MKILLINGSPRAGNTDLILNKIKDSLVGFSLDLVLLREKNIQYCKGCLFCDKNKKCLIKDDMIDINEKLLKSHLIIIGTPNYYDNVPALLKNFIDRTNPFYKTDQLKNKKIINIVVGGGKKENSQRVIDHALRFFTDAHKLNVVHNCIFKGLKIGEVLNDKTFNEDIEEVVDIIKSF